MEKERVIFPLLNGARQPPVKSFPGNPERRTLTYFRKKYT